MLDTKVFEVRDHATFIPVLCVRVNASFRPMLGDGPPARENYLIQSSGYGQDPLVIMTALRASDEFATYKTHSWLEKYGSRTRYVAHDYIQKHWAELKTGDVVDVQFILGETDKPCRPEMAEAEERKWSDGLQGMIEDSEL